MFNSKTYKVVKYIVVSLPTSQLRITNELTLWKNIFSDNEIEECVDYQIDMLHPSWIKLITTSVLRRRRKRLIDHDMIQNSFNSLGDSGVV